MIVGSFYLIQLTDQRYSDQVTKQVERLQRIIQRFTFIIQKTELDSPSLIRMMEQGALQADPDDGGGRGEH
jgi:hypothetical protein